MWRESVASDHLCVTPQARAQVHARWRLIGPMPIAQGNNMFNGQVSAIAIDPRDPNRVYIGTAAGGVWKTSDGGQHWVPLTDQQPASGIGSLALDPSNPDVIYAGTGSNFYAGHGVLKSTDAGATWKLLDVPFAAAPTASPNVLSTYAAGGTSIPSLVVDPFDRNVILAATRPVLPGSTASRGVYRSTDGGATWTNTLTVPFAFTVIFHPTARNVGFAAASGGIYKSIDGGATWTPLNGTAPNVITVPQTLGFNLTLVLSNPNTMYASNVSGPGIYRSVDGGKNWVVRAEPPIKECGSGVLVVHPTNPNVLFHGSVDLCRSTDGGMTWASVMKGANGAALHVDMHGAAFTRNGAKFLIGNDGGVWSTTEAAAQSLNWTNLNATLATVLFYPNGLSVHPTDPNIAIGGTQDNGELQFGGKAAWAQIGCGDGGTSVFDLGMPTTMYTACTNSGRIYKSTTAGRAWAEKTVGIDASDMQPTQQALAIDPSNPQRLYFGMARIYQSNDGAEHWRAIAAGGAGRTHIITVAPNDPNTVWAGGTAGIRLTRNALAADPAWADRTKGLPPRPVTQIVVPQRSPATAYVTLSHFGPGGHVFKTTDGGATWINLTANLPDAQAMDIVVDPDIADTLYLATDVGVFASSDGGSSWFPLGTALPRVSVQSLKLVRPTRVLRAATWGRSAWELSVPLPLQVR